MDKIFAVLVIVAESVPKISFRNALKLTPLGKNKTGPVPSCL